MCKTTTLSKNIMINLWNHSSPFEMSYFLCVTGGNGIVENVLVDWASHAWDVVCWKIKDGMSTTRAEFFITKLSKDS